MEEELLNFYRFSGSQNHWNEKYFLFQEMSLKRGDSCQFLVSKNYNKIWHFYNMFCNFCVSENFNMSLVCSGYASPDILLYSTVSFEITLLFISLREQCFCIYFLLCFVHMLFCTYSSSRFCPPTFVFKPVYLMVQSNLIIL